jgi:Ca2+-binding EF-hand superfamily protein
MKLREIRTGLKRRYINRNNLRKIFTDWDRGGNGYIRPEDVQEVLEDFGVPVNSKESAALVATANTSKTGYLNLSEFIEFVFPNTDVLDQVRSSRIGSSESAAGRLLGELQDKAAKVKRESKQGQLKANIKKYLPVLASDLIEAGDRVSLAAFTQAIMRLRIPSAFWDEASLKQLYMEAGGSAEGLDTREFVRSIRQFDGSTQPRRTSSLAEEGSFDLSIAKALHSKAKSASQITKSRLKQLLTEIEAKTFDRGNKRTFQVFKLFDADGDGEG